MYFRICFKILDYMILLDADISFCMVCKLWYISIRCIFKNLVLKLRIYNFRGVLCLQLSASPAIILPKTPSLHSLYYPTSSTIQAVFGVFAIVFAVYFFSSIPIVVDHLLYLFLYSIHYLSFLRELYIYCF